MNIKLITLTDKGVEDNDWRDLYVIEIDGEKVFEVGDGEPEDNNIARNFNDVYNLPDILNQVYNAGFNAERDGSLEFEYERVDEY